MAKFPPERLKSKSNQRTSIHRHIKVKRPKKLQQKSFQKTEAAKVNAITDQLDKLDKNRHHSKKNINHFSPLYESDDGEVTKHRMKPKSPIILLSEKEKGRKNKGDQNTGNEKYGYSLKAPPL